MWRSSRSYFYTFAPPQALFVENNRDRFHTLVTHTHPPSLSLGTLAIVVWTNFELLGIREPKIRCQYWRDTMTPDCVWARARCPPLQQQQRRRQHQQRTGRHSRRYGMVCVPTDERTPPSSPSWTQLLGLDRRQAHLKELKKRNKLELDLFTRFVKFHLIKAHMIAMTTWFKVQLFREKVM